MQTGVVPTGETDRTPPIPAAPAPDLPEPPPRAPGVIAEAPASNGASAGSISLIRFVVERFPWRPRPAFTHVLTAGIMLLLVGYGYVFSGRRGFRNVEESLWNSEIQLNTTFDRYAAKEAQAAILIPGSLPPEIKQRLFEQARLSLALSKDYLHTVKELYKFYYACLFMAFLTGALSAIILVLTTKDGWKNANEHLIVALAVLSVAAVYFGLAPSVFKYETNLESTKQGYGDCADIQGEILTYALSYKPQAGKTAKPEKAPEVFLREVDEKLKTARKVPLGFDASKLTSPSQVSKGINGQ